MGEQNSPSRPADESVRPGRAPWDDIDVESLHTVTDPAQVAILADPRRVRFIRPFLAREATVSEVAGELGVTANSLLYRVRRMTDAGLLRVVEERPRTGRAIKVYRSSYDGYRVPMSAMQYDDLRHRVDAYGRPLLDDLARAYTTALRDAPHHDRIIARNSAGEVWTTDLLPTKTRRGEPLVFADSVLWLDRRQAEIAQRHVHEALEAALSADDSEHSAGPRAPYLVMGAVLPLSDE
ncbi:ArsR/SmtB family transcription factor [Brachybacterium sacelli]|uniref:DNA-binding transcriptional ArsR family regulator n=1 Tax=Brachybacterium sacelli TaxID=173364 RepID=A0ABS4WWY7_9MICO|nr:helix-turn-helix domain-containing protein [Brachybacterium sacelli]MBP2380719.1 DNA-binding transcriptional ArsR family regulator [Brachybacterium sacelli]